MAVDYIHTCSRFPRQSKKRHEAFELGRSRARRPRQGFKEFKERRV